MATTLICSPTGEGAAGGELGVLPDPEDIQGPNLPLAEGGDNPLLMQLGVNQGWGDRQPRPHLYQRRWEHQTPPTAALPAQQGSGPSPTEIGHKDPEPGVCRHGRAAER